MSLAGDERSKDVVDQQLKQFIKIVAVNQKFQVSLLFFHFS